MTEFCTTVKKLTIGIEHRVQSSASEAVPETTVTKPPQPGGKGLLRNENKTVWEKLYIPTLQWKNGTLIFLTRKLIRRSIFHNKILVLRLKSEVYHQEPKKLAELKLKVRNFCGDFNARNKENVWLKLSNSIHKKEFVKSLICPRAL